MKTIEEFTKRQVSGRLRPELKMNDGFTMSVQASEGHYCDPRIDGLTEYTEMEIGFPSEKENLIMEWAEQKEDPTGTVYGFVPCDIINKVIEKHGGIDVEATFNK